MDAHTYTRIQNCHFVKIVSSCQQVEPQPEAPPQHFDTKASVVYKVFSPNVMCLALETFHHHTLKFEKAVSD